MAIQLTITADGRVTLPRAMLDHLGARPGQTLAVALLPDEKVEFRAGRDIRELRGILHSPGQRAVSLNEMQDAIESGPPD